MPGSPEIRAGALTLKPFARRDIADLSRWSPTPRFLMQWAGSTLNYPVAPEQFDDLFAQDEHTPQAMAWQVFAAGERRACGHAELARIDRERGCAHLARMLVAEPVRRERGLGGAIVRTILEVAHGQLGLRRVDLTVFVWNLAAIRCYTRAGFEPTGEPHGVVRVGDELWKTVAMSRAL